MITDNNKVTFSADLTTPGDFYKFTVDIVNEGSIDAMIDSIIKTPELTENEKKYLKYEVEYVDGTSISDSQLLKTGETKTISVLFSYRNDIPTSDLPTTESNYDLEIVLVYVQADTTGTEISGTNSVIKVVSGDLNTVGSEICIGEECFYLMNNDGYSITMLAKYNLYAGGTADANTSTYTAYGDEATGIQDSTMIGWLNSTTKKQYKGTLEFSQTNYWYNGSTLKHEYGKTYPAYVYDSNSSIYNYVENYKIYLESEGVEIQEARLIKIKELESLGCSGNSCSSGPEWVYLTSYWTGEAIDESFIKRIDSFGTYNNYKYNYNNGHGIRPVIEIPLTEF